MTHACTTGRSEGEIEKCIAENPTTYVREALLATTADDHVQYVHSELQSRARDVEVLAASIREVHDMFQDFGILVAHQHEGIDSIENRVRH